VLDIRTFLKGYTPADEEEAADCRSFLQFLDAFDPKDWATRENLMGHLTSSAWVVNRERTKILFAYHNIYQTWAWLGGHADGDLDLLHVAQKEAMEEAGLAAVTPVLFLPIDISVVGVSSHIKRGKVVPSHLHFNALYLLEADETAEIQHKPDENTGVAWFTNQELLDHVTEEAMKPLYSRIMAKVSKL
jgi:8-oxo-dGTP pyrophosphatase MutT (NUDIX family)